MCAIPPLTRLPASDRPRHRRPWQGVRRTDPRPAQRAGEPRQVGVSGRAQRHRARRLVCPPVPSQGSWLHRTHPIRLPELAPEVARGNPQGLQRTCRGTAFSVPGGDTKSGASPTSRLMPAGAWPDACCKKVTSLTQSASHSCQPETGAPWCGKML